MQKFLEIEELTRLENTIYVCVVEVWRVARWRVLARRMRRPLLRDAIASTLFVHHYLGYANMQIYCITDE